MQEKLPLLNLSVNNTLDSSDDIKNFDGKAILHPLYKDGGFNEAKLDEIIEKIPNTEISEDIESMYNYLRDHI